MRERMHCFRGGIFCHQDPETSPNIASSLYSKYEIRNLPASGGTPSDGGGKFLNHNKLEKLKTVNNETPFYCFSIFSLFHGR